MLRTLLLFWAGPGAGPARPRDGSVVEGGPEEDTDDLVVGKLALGGAAITQMTMTETNIRVLEDFKHCFT